MERGILTRFTRVLLLSCPHNVLRREVYSSPPSCARCPLASCPPAPRGTGGGPSALLLPRTARALRVFYAGWPGCARLLACPCMAARLAAQRGSTPFGETWVQTASPARDASRAPATLFASCMPSIAQFLAVCRASTLAETLRIAALLRRPMS